MRMSNRTTGLLAVAAGLLIAASTVQMAARSTDDESVRASVTLRVEGMMKSRSGAT